MDGSNRQVLHSTGLIWPNGITLDHETQRVYWVDAFLDRIEYSSYDGTGRVVLISTLAHPFALTIEGSLVFWTDWLDNSVYVTHKTTSLGVMVLRDHLRVRPYGIEAVTATRQANGEYLLSSDKSFVFVSAPKCRDVVLGSYVRTGYVISSTRAQCEQLKIDTPKST